MRIHVQIVLQVAIILTGNFNFFNYLTMVLCLLLLDDRDVSWLRCGWVGGWVGVGIGLQTFGL